MRIILTILTFLVWTKFVQSQCRQHTHVSCPGNTCFVINDTALDIKSSTASYAIVTGDCFVYDNTTGTGAGYTSEWSKGNDNWFAVSLRVQYKKKSNYLKCYKI